MAAGRGMSRRAQVMAGERGTGGIQDRVRRLSSSRGLADGLDVGSQRVESRTTLGSEAIF